MAQETYIATVQLVLRPGLVDSEAQACDAISGLFEEVGGNVLDWAYLKMNGQYLYPTHKTISDEEEYEEGEAFV